MPLQGQRAAYEPGQRARTFNLPQIAASISSRQIHSHTGVTVCVTERETRRQSQLENDKVLWGKQTPLIHRVAVNTRWTQMSENIDSESLYFLRAMARGNKTVCNNIKNKKNCSTQSTLGDNSFFSKWNPFFDYWIATHSDTGRPLSSTSKQLEEFVMK